MPELIESALTGTTGAANGGWAVTQATDGNERPVRVSALPLPSALSDAARARIAATLDQAVAACAQGRLSVLAWGEEAGRLYIVEPAPAGPSLGDMVASDGALTPQQVVSHLHALAGLLAALDAAGLPHSWPSPQNFYPGAVPQLAGQAWPAVFAILAAEDSSFEWPDAAYVAPEVLAGGKVSGASEAYAAAALTCFALTGRAPAADAGLDGCPPAVVSAIRKAMAPDPAARYKDIRTLVVDLTVEQAIGLVDAADANAVPDGGDVPDWARDLLRETAARRDAGRPLVDAAPAAATSKPVAADPPAARPAAKPSAATARVRPEPAAPEKPAVKPVRKTGSSDGDSPVFDWNATTPRKSVMPLVISVVTVLFIVAGIALTFLKK
jgi:hypothetical protein